MVRWCSSLLALPMLAGCLDGQAARPESASPVGQRYVAMGSSYAAGPGIGESADIPSNRCGRSTDNYAHRLARHLGMRLTDVSCSGATTAHILGSWDQLPAQVDAIMPDTRLVTLTIGGNDVGFVGFLFGASCRVEAHRTGSVRRCPDVTRPTEAQWTALEQSLLRIVAEVRRRAPAARLIFVDYPLVLPPHGTCAAIGVTETDADGARAIAARLATVTARAARAGGAAVLRASRLTRNHDACAREPWMNGLHPMPGDGVPFHPKLRGMQSVATALENMIH
ncbi:SGNH/GDSL hydrolase family protein [Sphingomonas mali]|uniref:SGNH/GDSL hydrolase family protein n=1 Tax=Sphingomonas mali TaxID=40682 RepID=UPI000A01FDB0|nr:SGNH/GDSL hydrolase family protein [Sphingomonas mali]